MTCRVLVSTFLLLAACGGGGRSSDAGLDGGRFDGGPRDAASDAGPCGLCSGDTPLCRESDGECVACLGDGDCGDERCDTEAGRCVECTGHAHCPASTPICGDDNTCRPCGDSDECTARDVSAPVCHEGQCVQCTEGETAACEGNPCTIGNICSAFGEGDRRPCESCDTDENCAEDYYCVPMNYKDAARPGGYCLRDFEKSCERPFSIGTMEVRITLSGVGDKTFCGIDESRTTCEAVRALLRSQACAGGTDEECPEGGICRKVGGLENHCTYECGGLAAQCPSSSPADTCEETYCGS